MTTIQGATKGVLYFILAILFIVTTYYTVPIFANLFQTPWLKALFYAGLIITYAVHGVIVPILLIVGKHDIDLLKAVYGVTSFLGAIFYVILAWQIVPPIVTILNNVIGHHPILTGIMHTGLIITFVLALIVVPNYFVFAGLQEEKLA